MKGQISTFGWVVIAILLLAVVGVVAWAYQLSVAVPVEYDGVFKVLGMNETELEWPFRSDFKITPATLSSGAVSVTGNMTLEVENGTTIEAYQVDCYQADYYFKISGGPVRNLNIVYEADSTDDVFDPDSIMLESAELWDYDAGRMIRSLPIDENGEVDYDTGVLQKGEYVVRLKFALKTAVTPSATEGTEDIIGYLSMEIDTDEDPTGAEAEEINDIEVTTLTK